MSASPAAASATKRSIQGIAVSTEPETGGEASAIRNMVEKWPSGSASS